MRPVFLLNMGVIIFMVQPASSKTHRFSAFGPIAFQRIIEKLAAVVAVEGEDGEGQQAFLIAGLNVQRTMELFVTNQSAW